MTSQDLKATVTFIAELWPGAKWHQAEQEELGRRIGGMPLSFAQAKAALVNLKLNLKFQAKACEVLDALRAAVPSPTASDRPAAPASHHDILRKRWTAEGHPHAMTWTDAQVVHAEHHFLRAKALATNGPEYCERFANGWASQMVADLAAVGVPYDDAVRAARDAYGIDLAAAPLDADLAAVRQRVTERCLHYRK